MKLAKKYVGILLALILLPAISNAQDITLKAAAPSVVAAGKYFQLKFETNAVNVSSRSLVPPSMENFNVVAGPMFSTFSSSSYVNGKVTESFSNQFIYTLIADKEGKFTVGEAEISVDGKTYRSKAITIEVVKDDSQLQNPPPGGGGSTQQQGSSGNTGSTAVGGEDIFVRTSVSNNTPYKGECIVATVKIYVKPEVGLSGLENYKLPTFNGFYSQDLDPTAQPQFTTENYNGRVYNSAVLKRYILFPQQSGTLTIDPFETTAVVQVRANTNTRSVFDDFFGSQTQLVHKKLTSSVIKVNVKDLPAGAPASFTGAVGDFTIEASLSKDQVVANNAISMLAKISGTGNMKLFDAPKPELPTDFEVYDTKTSENLRNSVSGITGSRQFETPFVPRSAGNFTVPSIQFSYFNPSKKQYVILSTKELSLTVDKDTNQSQSIAVTNSRQQEVKEIGTDIRSLKSNPQAWRTSYSSLFGSLTYYTLYGIAILLFIIAAYLLKERRKTRQNVQLTRHKKANAMARKRLTKASKLLQSGEVNGFYEELLKAYWGYLSDKLSIPVAELSQANVREALTAKNVDAETTDAFIAVVDECEFARYAPGTGKTEMESEYSNALEIITKLEQKIR